MALRGRRYALRCLSRSSFDLLEKRDARESLAATVDVSDSDGAQGGGAACLYVETFEFSDVCMYGRHGVCSLRRGGC